MTEKGDFLLKYFFMCGVSQGIKNKLKINEFNQINEINPILLSSYSAEGKTELFEILKNKLNEDNYLKYNIFPIKANFLSKVIFPSNPLDTPSFVLETNPFNQYIETKNSFNEMPEHFCHCFQYIFKIDEKEEDNICLNFTVLIFYENVTDERDFFKENKEKDWLSSILFIKSIFYNTFVAKALILVSEKPIFSFMKEILENIYRKYIIKKYTYFPVEQIIINCFEKVNNDNLEESSDKIRNYRIYKEPILPYCDLNISFFCKIFDLKDIFQIAEYYLCSKNIIITCTNVEFLFPIYYIFMTLFFPLNKNSNERFYKLIVPDEQNLQRTLFGMLPTFQFIYDDGNLNEKLLMQICKIKEDILLFELIEDKSNKNEYSFNKYKKILKYENKDNNENFIKEDLSKYKTIIEKVCEINKDIFIDLIDLLNNDMLELMKYFDTTIKIPTFFYFSFDNTKYDSLRNHFIGLFIKFFVTCLNPIKFNLKDNKIEIDIIEFNRFKNDEIANDLLNTLYSTPQSDLIYKNQIIKNGQFDNNVLKKIILLDYFLKVSSIDKNRAYFVPKSSSDNKNIRTSLNLVELFNINDILDKRIIFYYFNRLYLYDLQNNIKDHKLSIGLAINFIEHITFYQNLTKKDNSKEIENIKFKTGLKYIIFFGENFELHFSQFVKKSINNYNYLSYSDYKDESKLSHKKFFDINEKYYKAILNEVEIFYDLYITQIIPIENREELAALAIGLYISIYIINLLSELNQDNKYNDNLLEIINKKKVKLFKLFEKTKGFYGKFDFLITLLFEIVFYRQFNDNFKELTEKLIKKLELDQILPSIIIILMYNHNISLDFNMIKKYNEKLKGNNRNINKKSERNKTDENNQKKEENNKIENYEPINEVLIYNIERNNHEHNYDIMKGINDNYLCENKNCTDILSFSIQEYKDGEKSFNMVINPKYIIIKIFKKILDNNSLFIHSYNDINDIYQIVMLDELYFKIGFFKSKKDNKEN